MCYAAAMTIETILEYLNAVSVRATYGAVGDVLGVRPQVVPRLLGAPPASGGFGIVNGRPVSRPCYTPGSGDRASPERRHSYGR